jgi:WD40 repeat protein
VWNLDGELIADLDKHEGEVYKADFSPDGSSILTTPQDKTAKFG